MNVLNYVRGYIFYLESTEGVNTAKWSEVKAAAAQASVSPYGEDDWKTYSVLNNLNSSKLPEVAGTYVLFVTYTDGQGNTKQISASVEVESMTKPEISCRENGFTVDMNGLDYVRGYIFYLESADGINTNSWSAVMNAARAIEGSSFNDNDDWKTYSKLDNLNKASLPAESGVYVLFVTYLDADGATQQISEVITK